MCRLTEETSKRSKRRRTAKPQVVGYTVVIPKHGDERKKGVDRLLQDGIGKDRDESGRPEGMDPPSRPETPKRRSRRMSWGKRITNRPIEEAGKSLKSLVP